MTDILKEYDIDKCLQCDNPSIKIPIITGDDIEIWCSKCRAKGKESAIPYLGDGTYEIIFSLPPAGWEDHNNIPLWAYDIGTVLALATMDMYSALITDSDHDKIFTSAKIVDIKAKEYISAHEVAGDKSVMQMNINIWMSKPHVTSIGGPLGAKTIDVFNYIMPDLKWFVIPREIVDTLLCMVLAAKRVMHYYATNIVGGADVATELIRLETDIWNSHHNRLGE